MFAINPFAALSAAIPPAVMQAYVVAMIVLVAAGTLFDIVHKGSARYFFDNWRSSKREGAERARRRRIGVDRSPDRRGGCPRVRGILQRAPPRRPSADHVRLPDLRRLHRRHGVRLSDAATAPDLAAPLVDRRPRWSASAATGSGSSSASMSPPRATRRCASCARICSSSRSWPASRSALIWAWAAGARQHLVAMFGLALYIIATTVLFGSVPWSKFAHMFFKPAAAFEKRVSYANGIAEQSARRPPTSPSSSAARALRRATTDGHSRR